MHVALLVSLTCQLKVNDVGIQRLRLSAMSLFSTPHRLGKHRRQFFDLNRNLFQPQIR